MKDNHLTFDCPKSDGHFISIKRQKEIEKEMDKQIIKLAVKELIWIKKWEHIISVSEIEAFIGCPKKTIQNAINGIENLPEKWSAQLKTIIEEIRK